MISEDRDCCRNCRFWGLNIKGRGSEYSRHACQRMPPTIPSHLSPDGTAETKWIETNGRDYCGEFMRHFRTGTSQ